MKIKSKVRGGLQAISATTTVIRPGGCNPSTRTLGPVTRPILVQPVQYVA